eukprot:276890_1
MNSSQTHIDQYKIPLNLQHQMQNWATQTIIKRCKGILKSQQEAMNVLRNIFRFDAVINHYSIPQHLFDKMIAAAHKIIKHKCQQGIRASRVTKPNVSMWIRLQNFWLHIAPETLTKHFYNDILIFTAHYFDTLSFDTTNISLSMPEIIELLKKKFLFHLLTSHLQMNRQSTKNGPIMQDKAFKILKIQNIISNKFDSAWQSKWQIWMNSTSNGKKNRIQTIMKKYVRPFAKERLSQCMNKLQIYIEIREIAIEPKHIKLFDEYEPIGNSNSNNNNNNNNNLHIEHIEPIHSPSTEPYYLPDGIQFPSIINNQFPPCLSPIPMPIPIIQAPEIQNMNINNENKSINFNFYGSVKGSEMNTQKKRYSPMSVDDKMTVTNLQKENEELRALIKEYKEVISNCIEYKNCQKQLQNQYSIQQPNCMEYAYINQPNYVEPSQYYYETPF